MQQHDNNDVSDEKSWVVVVSRFNERLDWLKPIASRVYVYNKGSDDDTCVDDKESFAGWEKLENVGREGDTYLHHIIKHFNDTTLPDVTVFTQAKIDDHIAEDNDETTPLQLLYDLVKTTRTNNMSPYRYVAKVASEFRHDEYKGKKLTPSHEPFSVWFERVIGAPFPEKSGGVAMIPFHKNGIFAVGSELFNKRKKAYYLNIKKELNHLDPETGHFLERSWAYVFHQT